MLQTRLVFVHETGTEMLHIVIWIRLYVKMMESCSVALQPLRFQYQQCHPHCEPNSQDGNRQINRGLGREGESGPGAGEHWGLGWESRPAHRAAACAMEWGSGCPHATHVTTKQEGLGSVNISINLNCNTYDLHCTLMLCVLSMLAYVSLSLSYCD